VNSLPPRPISRPKSRCSSPYAHVDSVAKELGPAGIVRFVSALTGHLDIRKICGLKLAQNLCILDKAILCGLMLEDCSTEMLRTLHAQQEAVTALQKYIDAVEKERG